MKFTKKILFLFLCISILPALAQQKSSGVFSLPAEVRSMLNASAREAIVNYLKEASSDFSSLDSLFMSNKAKTIGDRDQNAHEWTAICQKNQASILSLKAMVKKNLAPNANATSLESWFQELHNVWGVLSQDVYSALVSKDNSCIMYQNLYITRQKNIEVLKRYYEMVGQLDLSYHELNKATNWTGIPDAKKSEMLQNARTSLHRAKLIVHFTEKDEKAIRSFLKYIEEALNVWSSSANNIDKLAGFSAFSNRWKAQLIAILKDTEKALNAWKLVVAPVLDKKLLTGTSNLQAFQLQDLPPKFGLFLHKIEQLLKDRVMFKCPYCAYKGDEPIAKSGKVVRCKRCQKEIRLP